MTWLLYFIEQKNLYFEFALRAFWYNILIFKINGYTSIFIFWALNFVQANFVNWAYMAYKLWNLSKIHKN